MFDGVLHPNRADHHESAPESKLPTTLTLMLESTHEAQAAKAALILLGFEALPQGHDSTRALLMLPQLVPLTFDQAIDFMMKAGKPAACICVSANGPKCLGIWSLDPRALAPLVSEGAIQILREECGLANPEQEALARVRVVGPLVQREIISFFACRILLQHYDFPLHTISAQPRIRRDDPDGVVCELASREGASGWLDTE